MFVLTILLLCAPHLMRALMFVVQVSHIVTLWNQVFRVTELNSTSAFPRFIFILFDRLHRSQSLLLKIQAFQVVPFCPGAWPKSTAKLLLSETFQNWEPLLLDVETVGKSNSSCNRLQEWQKLPFHEPNFLRQVFCSFLNYFMYGKSSRHSFGEVDIVDSSNSSRSRARSAVAMFLKTRTARCWWEHIK